MPLALKSSGGVMNGGSSNFINDVPSFSIGDRDFPADQDAYDSDASSSSSIGRNSSSSADSSHRGDSGENEVQSSFKGPLDNINDIEEVLPVKKGISKFYSGKSKSFTSLADAASATSMQDIVKPEDPYAKKRKNLIARNILINRTRSYSDNIGGISKRQANIGRGTSCLSLSNLSNNIGNNEDGSFPSISPPCSLPPLHPHAKRAPANASLPCPLLQNSAWRSYSWSDLQSVAAEAHDISGLAICTEN